MQRTFRSTLLIPLLCVILQSAAIQGALLAQSPERSPEIIDNRTGKTVSLPYVIQQIAWCDVIYLGEKHDNDSGHQFQREVVQGLLDAGKSLVLSTEQFERDVQGAVDDYLADRITEEQFLASSRPWKNYPEHYRPIIELAKAKQDPSPGS